MDYKFSVVLIVLRLLDFVIALVFQGFD